MSSNGVIGSGTPYLDGAGNLRIRGTFAGTAKAQEVRQLVTEGHLQGASVEFLNGPDGRQLLGCGIVYVPSNPDARVLTAKDFSDRPWWPELKAFTDGLDADGLKTLAEVLAEAGAPASTELKRAVGAVDAIVRKSGARNSAADQKLVQHLHDTAVALGATCADEDDGDEEPAPDDGDGSDDGANKHVDAEVQRKRLLLDIDLL
ncbi:hypothetical protein [Tsukamurella soli]